MGTVHTTVVGEIVGLAAWLYFLLLLGRVVFSWVFTFARDWEPKGVMLVVVEGIYTATDPPLKVLRKVIPPIRLGPVSIDLAIIVLFILLGVIMNLAPRL